MSQDASQARGAGAGRAVRDDDADPDDGRDETVNQRMDRNWVELLQELRVTQTGTQILTGFLLAVAFQQKFDDLTAGQHRLYLGLIVTAVLTTALALAPVNVHRALFRRHAKVRLVTVSDVLLRIVLLGVALVLAGTVVLIFDVVAGRGAAVGAAAGALVVLVALGLLPRLVRARDRRA
ncbi:hypothetical protein GCM10022197_20280 [Microlunatus spumicola]|uniref:Sodium:proton antiporter n=1 Tax=Microlunatus spumicola TaxID=81499 RepID=A0ABP6XC60_9ACTN